jgi:hypothetical protein
LPAAALCFAAIRLPAATRCFAAAGLVAVARGFLAAGLFETGRVLGTLRLLAAPRLPRFATAFGLGDVRARAIAATLSRRDAAHAGRAMLAA